MGHHWGCAVEISNIILCPGDLFHAGRACCAAAGPRRRESERAEAVEAERAELASSDSEENGIALGNAPGARGELFTLGIVTTRVVTLMMAE